MATDRTEAERLNRYLDAEVGGSAADPGDLDPAFEATFRRVRAMAGEATTVAAGTTPAIDPRLKQQLWRDIMSNTPGTAIAATPPRAKPRRRGWDRGMTWQSLAVAALLVAMLGSLLYGPRSGSDQRTAIAPPSLQGDQAKGAAMFRQNPGRTGVSADAGPMAEPGVLWRATLEQTSFSGLQPVLAVDGTLILVDSDQGGFIQAMSVETGAVLWTRNLDLRGIGNYQLAGEGLVFASTGGSEDATGMIVALDQSTGLEIWRTTDLGGFQAAPLIDSGKLIFISTDRMLRVVDAKTGNEEWHLDIAEMSIAATSGTPFPVETSGLQQYETLAVANGLAYFSAGDGVLYAVDLTTHELAWFLKTEGNVVSTPAIAGSDLYFAANWINPDPRIADAKEGGTLYKLNANTGDMKWKQSTTLDLRIDAVLGRHVIANTTLFRTDTGEVDGQLPDGVLNPVFTADAIYWLDQNGQMHAERYVADAAAFTPLWTVYLGMQGYSPPIVAGESLISRGPHDTVVSLGGNAATPVAGATSATGQVTDLSGLAPCIAPPPVDWKNVEGEPAHTLETYTDQIIDGTAVPISPGFLYQPWFDYNNVPEGTPADASMIAGIQQTIADARVCARPGNTVDDSGFFSEDYYRRAWVQEKLAQRQEPMLSIFFDLVVDWLPPVESATVLDDGRVGVLLDPGPPMVDNFALYFVFVEKDGYWVVDEVIRVGPGALQG